MRYLPSGKIIVDDLDELRYIIEKRKIDLALIDIKASGLKSLYKLFSHINKINGSIEDWDVSDIESLHLTFVKSKIQPNLSKWDVSNVVNLFATFYESKFNGDISNWNTSKVSMMNYTFQSSKFNGDISKWDVSNVKDFSYCFSYSAFNGDISKWDVSNVLDAKFMFASSIFNGDISFWKLNNEINTYSIFKDNLDFKNKYNEGNEIPNNSQYFLEWFEENKDKIYEIHNINQDKKIELDDYLSTFNLQGVDK